MTCLRSHPHDPDEACDGSVRHLYAKGVHDERERIIALIDQSNTFYLADRFGVYAERKIREALTPKE